LGGLEKIDISVVHGSFHYLDCFLITVLSYLSQL
jgi:hypothetical protein